MKKLLLLLSITTLGAQAKLAVTRIENPYEEATQNRKIFIKTNDGFEELNDDTLITFDSLSELPNEELQFGYSRNNLYKLTKDQLKNNAILFTDFAQHPFPVPLIFIEPEKAQ